jgi:hypothetical protein
MLQITKVPFPYKIIPANAVEPIRPGVAVMWEYPHIKELVRVIQPLLDGAAMMRLAASDRDGARIDMFRHR